MPPLSRVILLKPRKGQNTGRRKAWQPVRAVPPTAKAVSLHAKKSMSNKKTIVNITAFILLVLVFIGGVTLTYFTTEGKARNVVTTGGIDIELNEYADTGNGLVAFADVEGVNPGSKASKIVAAENVGKHPAFVRMKVDLATTAEGMDARDAVTADFNTDDWTYRGGYYYYDKPLAPGEETPPLFTTVTFSSSMDEMWENAKVTVNVTVYGVQSENNGESALDAGGWPEKE